MFVAFFDFPSDPNLNTLQDNELKTAISGIRTSLQKTGYKTKFAVVLLSEKTVVDAPDIDERISNIRRGTGLDPKTGIFFLPTTSSRVEITSFVTNLLTTLQPMCIEFYRDLTKHSRRKKNRGSVPPPTIPPTKTTSQPLSTHGWNVRYDVKLGILAELRQEMDSACRHYTSALETLMGSEGVFETTVSWSPRWDEGRLLADMLAFRIIRCLLWSQMSTTATQSWVNYKDRMHELVDRRGKGSANYGWEAWESRWAAIMAELIRKAEIPAISVMDSIDMTTSMILAKSENATYLQPERAFTGVERIPPWHHMHHTGYWMRLSARNAKRRLRYSNAIPEEDRVTPQMSSAPQRSKIYDTYLCPQPYEEASDSSHQGFDHATDIIERLDASNEAFVERKQKRFSQRLQLEIGREHIRKQDYKRAVDVLRTIWKECSWREEKWWLPLFELDRLLAEAARYAEDTAVLVSAIFELHAPQLRMMRDMKLDLMNCAKSSKTVESESKPKIRLSPSSTRSFINASFIFETPDGNVGEGFFCQLRIFSDAHTNTAPITLSKIKGIFKQNRYTFEISHSRSFELQHLPPEPARSVTNVELVDKTGAIEVKPSEDGPLNFSTEANLEFKSGRYAVYMLSLDIKEPGELELEHLEIEIMTDEFELTLEIKPVHFIQPVEWFFEDDAKLLRKRIVRSEPWSADIRPKPPKLHVQIINIDRSIYTDEPVKIDFEVTNDEQEDVTATVDVRILSRGAPPEVIWIHSDESEPSSDNEGESQSLRSITLSTLKPGKSLRRTATFTAPSAAIGLILESKIHYFLPSDPEVPLSKTFTSNMSVTSPFEANYTFTPRIHPNPWPSYFSFNSSVPGLLQRWNLSADVASFTNEAVTLQKVSFEIDKKPSTVETTIISGIAEDGTRIQPHTMRSFDFSFDTTRPSPKEQRTMSLTGKVTITWSRINEDDVPIASTILVSPLQLPPLEPRVVAMTKGVLLPLSEPKCTELPLSLLTLFMENPTGHPLTFDITVPSSDTFAFAGLKQQSVSLLPYSRSEVDFRLVPLVRNTWITFGVKVVDRWFVREVEIQPGEGLRATEEGGAVMWHAD